MPKTNLAIPSSIPDHAKSMKLHMTLKKDLEGMVVNDRLVSWTRGAPAIFYIALIVTYNIDE